MEGLFSPSYALPIAIGAAGIGLIGSVTATVLLFRLRKFKKDLASLFSGKTGTDLEEIVMRQKEGLDALDEEIRKLYGIAEQLYRLGNESLHKTELLRFNPFKEVGGNQSFALALLNGKNTGFVISSIHTREGTRVYAKPIENGSEVKEYPLSDEEKKTIGQAISKRSVAFTRKEKG
ncbi:MAG: DUF4446 family protein [Candidatus Moranbacteria bacterium]|nr:DUF4446 family protein [Candidatus Moranbacteria bacterium]